MLKSDQNIFAALGAACLLVSYHATPWKGAWYRRVLTWIAVTQFNTLSGWGVRYYQCPTVYLTALARVLRRSVHGLFYITEMLVHAHYAGIAGWRWAWHTRSGPTGARSRSPSRISWTRKRRLPCRGGACAASGRRPSARSGTGATGKVLEGIHSS